MTEDPTEIQRAIEAFHDDVPHRFQVSLTMSIDVRDDISNARNELNAIADGQSVTTNDVMRLALVAAARYHELASDDSATPALDAVDRDQLVPLTGVLRQVVDPDSLVEVPDETS